MFEKGVIQDQLRIAYIEIFKRLWVMKEWKLIVDLDIVDSQSSRES